ncbi:uncharacterized protein G2W53_015997 [Senna tora]|uniref:Uncharacterized protein n=1 Tax=Senna tora TaxID=362788 RepID=A0A834WWA2_9FABA|nr:uncharacterized protein G2W53_015997 [Senna tora]
MQEQGMHNPTLKQEEEEPLLLSRCGPEEEEEDEAENLSTYTTTGVFPPPPCSDFQTDSDKMSTSASARVVLLSGWVRDENLWS